MATTERDATERIADETAAGESAREASTADAATNARPTDRKACEDTYRVRSPMDEEGYMRVSPLGRRETCTVVDYAGPIVENKLADLPEGATVRLDLAPVPDSDTVVVSRVLPGTAGVVA
jgi:hypothetical protein